jgi:spore maturation protein CgeB
MAACRNLFNHQQKHDGPNLRVMESMLMRRPLICDNDPTSGMDKLFKAGVHYIPYESYTYNGLGEAMKFAMDNPLKAKFIADLAYDRILKSHLVEHRIEQIMEVFIDGL